MIIFKKPLMLSILIFNILCLAQFAGGSGTIVDPYQIATADHLNNIRYNLTASYIQTADIDLGVAPWNVGAGWDPIGDYDPWDPSKSFRGNYDGNGYTINNLLIVRLVESNLGLFGSMFGCKINNVRLINFLINSEGSGPIGGISGIAYENDVSGCYSEGKIFGHSEIGLLFGFFEQNSISDCHVKGEITATGSYIGGLVGLCSITDSITDCSADVELYADRLNIGGIIGYSVALSIFSKNSANCLIVAYGEAAGCSGGLIGNLNSDLRNCIISECYSTGTIDAKFDNAAGGLIGGAQNVDSHSIFIENSFSSVDVIGNKAVGGLVGGIIKNTIVTNSYSTGSVTGNSEVGGLIGRLDSLDTVTVTNCYWNIETSGQTTSAAGEGRTTAEMTLPSYGSNTYVGWDFGSVWADDIYNLNEGYPRLEWACSIEGDEDDLVDSQKGFDLFQNYPNPFNPVTQINFALSKTADVKLSVYNISGQLVSQLASGTLNAGVHAVDFDGSRFNSGVYYYSLEIEGKNITKKMLLTK
jgi:hypothetical protein